jgi:metal-dependent hydrolase (beta-lactamase superfamily II)
MKLRIAILGTRSIPHHYGGFEHISEALIAAHNNPFNKSVLNSDAFYFSKAKEVRNLVETVQRQEVEKVMVSNNPNKIKYQFNWKGIIDQYEQFIIECHNTSKHERIIANRG